MIKHASILAAVAGLAVLAAAATPAQSWRESDRDWKSFKTEDIRKTLKFADPSNPGEVAVDNVFGPVTVEGYAGAEVVLEARRIVYARDEARARKAEEEVSLDIGGQGNSIEIYVDGPFREDEGERRNGASASGATPATRSITDSRSRSRRRRASWSPRSPTATSRSAGSRARSTCATSTAGSGSRTRPPRATPGPSTAA
ncbi:MAG: hypothetical protein M0C28_12275 [Candidatus Moduliflexus flocculans]|nr:hypothetical protein [Candidatus Moduliflexus flocculans]